MMLVWRSYNYLSLDYTKYYRRLVTIEQDGVCCGFGPPTRCQVTFEVSLASCRNEGIGFVRTREYNRRIEDMHIYVVYKQFKTVKIAKFWQNLLILIVHFSTRFA